MAKKARILVILSTFLATFSFAIYNILGSTSYLRNATKMQMMITGSSEGPGLLVLSDAAAAAAAADPMANFSASLPSFYKQYFQWHAQQMQELKTNISSWESKTFLIMECYAYFSPKQNKTVFSKPCGGLSDRLTPLPLLVWIAHRTRRILFIYWNRPMGLEEFLEPASVLDWRMPRELVPHLVGGGGGGTLIKNERNAYAMAMTGPRVVRSRLQMPGEETFRKKTKLSYEDVFPDLWTALFRPVPRLQTKIDAQLAAHGLTPDQYAATHIRARHNKHFSSAEVIQATNRALRCTSQLFPGAPILVASDLSDVYEVARNVSLEYLNYSFRVETLDENSFIHLDWDPQWETRTADDYDGVFQDLYLLGSAKCVSHGVGGYGKFGMRMTVGASTCGFDHAKLPRIPCAFNFSSNTNGTNNGTTTSSP